MWKIPFNLNIANFEILRSVKVNAFCNDIHLYDIKRSTTLSYLCLFYVEIPSMHTCSWICKKNNTVPTVGSHYTESIQYTSNNCGLPQQFTRHPSFLRVQPVVDCVPFVDLNGRQVVGVDERRSSKRNSLINRRKVIVFYFYCTYYYS